MTGVRGLFISSTSAASFSVIGRFLSSDRGCASRIFAVWGLAFFNFDSSRAPIGPATARRAGLKYGRVKASAEFQNAGPEAVLVCFGRGRRGKRVAASKSSRRLFVRD